MANYIDGQFYYGQQVKIKTAVNLSPNTPTVNRDFLRNGKLYISFDVQANKIVLMDLSGLWPGYKWVKNPKGKQVSDNQDFIERLVNPLEDSEQKQILLNAIN